MGMLFCIFLIIVNLDFYRPFCQRCKSSFVFFQWQVSVDIVTEGLKVFWSKKPGFYRDKSVM